MRGFFFSFFFFFNVVTSLQVYASGTEGTAGGIEARAGPSRLWDYGLRSIDDSSAQCAVPPEDAPELPDWCEGYVGTDIFCSTRQTSHDKQLCLEDRMAPIFWAKNTETSNMCDYHEYRDSEKCVGTKEWCKVPQVLSAYDGQEAECLRRRGPAEVPHFLPWAYGGKSHCEMMHVLAETCKTTFLMWHYGTHVRNFCRPWDEDDACGIWWDRMGMNHLLDEHPVPRDHDEQLRWEAESGNSWAVEHDHADVQTGTEWRIACARAVSQSEACKRDTANKESRDLELMHSPTWIRARAVQLDKDKEAGRKLNDSAEQYSIQESFNGDMDWERREGDAAIQAWQNRLLKLEECRWNWDKWNRCLLWLTGFPDAQGAPLVSCACHPTADV